MKATSTETDQQIRKQRDAYRTELEWFKAALEAHTNELEAPTPKLKMWAEHITDTLRRQS